MNDNRMGGTMLVAGCVAGLITMAFHPVAHHGAALSAQDLAKLARLDRAVHGLAIAGVTMVTLGALALTRRLASGNRLALAALVVYGLAAAAIIVAGTMDGFVAADLVDRMAASDAKSESWWLLLDYNTRIVIAFASVYAVGACAAIALWSLAILRGRQLPAVLAVYGLLIGLAIPAALFAGALTLDVHGMGLVALAQAIWFIVAGVSLRRAGGVRLEYQS